MLENSLSPRSGKDSAGSGSSTIEGNDLTRNITPSQVDQLNSEQFNSEQFSILPSYQMYEALVAKSAAMDHDLDSSPAPPYSGVSTSFESLENLQNLHQFDFPLPQLNHDMHNLNEAISRNSTMGSSRSESIRSGPDEDSMSMMTEFTTSSNLTVSSTKILDVHHKLKTLALTANTSVSIHFTARPNTPGEFPFNIDSELREFSPGDDVYGYVIAENKSNTPIPFSTFYVMFEGNIVESTGLFTFSAKLEKNKTFLQTLDLCASSTASLLEENYKYDSTDNTYLEFHNNSLRPATRYKRFFQFKIPESLLETSCDTSNHIHLYDLLPTIDSTLHNTLSFLGTKILYTIRAKFITPDAHSQQYVTLKELSKEIRVIPIKNIPCKESAVTDRYFARSAKDHLIYTMKDYIKMAKHERNALKVESNPKQQYSENQDSTSKASSLKIEEPNQIHTSEIVIQRKFLGLTKVLGNLLISVPTETKYIDYIAPSNFRTSKPSQSQLDSWNVEVPVTLCFSPTTEKYKLPEITHIDASIVTFSYASDGHSFPIQLTHDMVFNNETEETFSDIISSPFKKLATELSEELRRLAPDLQIVMDQKVLDDVKTINRVRTKTNILDINDVSINGTSKSNSTSVPWIKQENTHYKNLSLNLNLPTMSPLHYTKEMQIKVNIANSMERRGTVRDDTPSYEKFCLVPEFQNESLGRLYYLLICILILDGTVTTTRIPLSIVHLPK